MLAFAAFSAAPLAMAEERDWIISDILGWYSQLSDITDADAKVEVKKNSVTIYYKGPSDWSKRRGRFEKLGRNLFVLIPEEWTDGKGTDLLAKGWRAFLRVEISNTWKTYKVGERPVLKIYSFISMEELRTRKTVCPGLSYFSIGPPFDRPTN